jgi:phosphoribosyl 1,2-cyclic phosphodiesterase
MGIIINVLGSGSSGNSILISSGKTALLIDAGFSAKALHPRILSLPIKPSDINAIIISHEHADHNKGWKSCGAFFDVPVYMTPPTQYALNVHDNNKKVSVKTFEKSKPFIIGDFRVLAFPVPHDSVEPVGFIVEYKHHKIAIATDLGYMTKLVNTYLSECNIIILESNHDVSMLLEGPYPWELKQRILSHQGHLSNDNVGTFVKENLNEQCLYLFLAHISRKNNTPELALTTSLANLQKNRTTKIIVTYQDTVSETVEV